MSRYTNLDLTRDVLSRPRGWEPPTTRWVEQPAVVQPLAAERVIPWFERKGKVSSLVGTSRERGC